MKYEEFNELVNYVYRKNNQKEPIFAVVKELFDYIDCRQDGMIDIHEWTQIFRKIEVMSIDYRSMNNKNHLAIIWLDLKIHKKMITLYIWFPSPEKYCSPFWKMQVTTKHYVSTKQSI